MTKRASLLFIAVAGFGCGDDTIDLDVPGAVDAGAADAVGAADVGGAADAGLVPDGGSVLPECESVVEAFVTLGSANPNLPDPSVSASCDGVTVTVSSNSIPDFPYIETSPGDPREFPTDYEFPLAPTLAAEVSEVPRLGALGVAVNGIPIFGQAEGTGGDVMSLGGGFTECGGHNGPAG